MENNGSTWNFHGSDRTRTVNNALHFNDAKSKDLKSRLLWAARKMGIPERSVPRVEPAIFLSAPDLESHLEDVQKVKPDSSAAS
ncbi:hypothetical protein [Streptomyces sp. NPDC004675]|uniref:hypothetical protein n=1 Tax=Streptomyces sp. NPDC004675 TaxID=3154286 RepID=UPI0033A209E1